MALSHSPSIISNNLILYLDAANPKSYVGAGTSWTDLIASKTSTLTNGPTYDSSNLGSIVFDGLDDYVGGNSSLTLGSNFTISIWTKHSSLSNVQKYFSFGDFDRVLVQNNTNGNLNLYVDGYNQQNLFTWGRNDNGPGQLGIGTTINTSTPVTTFAGGTNWKLIAQGYQHTAAIKTDGTLWLWGSGASGELGVNDTTDRLTPVTTILGGTNWKSVACGFFYNLAIKTDGTLWVWGRNSKANLGINNTSNKSTPVTTLAGGTNWKSVSCAGYTSAAIKTDGTLWVWGQNTTGGLGVNDTGNRSTPVTTILGGTNWKSVDVGGSNLADVIGAIKTDGTLWNWGNNASGGLGVNDTVNRSTPVTTILGGNDWKDISSATNTTIAIKTDGTLWNWGAGTNGILGTNDSTNISTPVTTFAGGTNWKSIGGIGRAIKTDGTLWVWGLNNFGQLGINNISTKNTPVTTFLGGNNWKTVSGGGNHTLAIRTDTTFTNNLQVNSSLSNSTFYNIVATCDGTTLTLYQNGTSVSTAALGGTLNSIDGSFNISSELEAFSGNLYSVMVYNKALTSTEIQQNFNALRGRFGI